MDLVDNSMNKIEDDLQSSCIHSIVDDYIDVSYGEKSIKITYCEKCFIDSSKVKLRRSNLSIPSNSVCTTSR
jgi:hypothetical protein